MLEGLRHGRRSIAAASIAAMLAAPSALLAQSLSTPIVKETATPPARAEEMVLKTRRAMPKNVGETWLTVDGVPVVRNITTPTLTAFLPSRDKATGAAVILAPGGAFMLLAIDNEGYAAARWLQSQGVAAFVLKYRVRPTKPGAVGLAAELAALGGPPPTARAQPSVASPPMEAAAELAADDAEEAMLAVKGHAQEWQIDPTRIGFMGFSAGAITAVNLVYRNNPATMPAFIVPIYGNLTASDRPLPEKLPAMWAAVASDDRLFGGSDLSLLRAWHSKGGAVEFHLFEGGGHGFGYPGREGTTSEHWSQEFLWWMQAHGLLDKTK